VLPYTRETRPAFNEIEVQLPAPYEASLSERTRTHLITSSWVEPAQSGRIRGFDGLRAIAFLLVFASHKINFQQADSIGDVGVWLFFVLSGFLITRILARSRIDIESGASTIRSGLANFYLKRTSRIFPPYYLLLGSAAALHLYLTIDNFRSTERLTYFLFGTNILIATHGYWPGDFGHFWSLAVEEQFYLLFAPFVLFVPRKNTIGVCVAIIAVSLMTKITMEDLGSSPLAIDVNSFVNFGLLAFGGIIGLTASVPPCSWLCSGTAQLFMLGFYLSLPTAFGTYPVWPVLGKASAILAGILLLQIFTGQKTWFVAVLESAPLRKIGRASYGAYLIHHFIHFETIGHALDHLGVEIDATASLKTLTELAMTLALAALSWRYFESPIISLAARSVPQALTRRRPH